MLNRRSALVAIAGLAAINLLGCKEPPVPGRVAIGGDSLTVQAGYYGGGLGTWDDDQKVGIGWQAEHIQPRATLDVEDPAASPATLVVALGQNDAASSWGRDGFTDQDRDQLRELAETPADGACVAMVKPWYQPPAGQPFDQAQMDGIVAYRAWVDGMVAADPERYRSVDWRPVAEVHPEYLAADGIHLVVPSTLTANELTVAYNRNQVSSVEYPAAGAYLDVLRAGAAACGAEG